MNKCLNCGSKKVSNIVIDRQMKHQGKNIKITGIKAIKCSDCQEVYLSNGEAINNFLRKVQEEACA